MVTEKKKISDRKWYNKKIANDPLFKERERARKQALNVRRRQSEEYRKKETEMRQLYYQKQKLLKVESLIETYTNLSKIKQVLKGLFPNVLKEEDEKQIEYIAEKVQELSLRRVEYGSHIVGKGSNEEEHCLSSIEPGNMSLVRYLLIKRKKIHSDNIFKYLLYYAYNQKPADERLKHTEIGQVLSSLKSAETHLSVSHTSLINSYKEIEMSLHDIKKTAGNEKI